MLQYWLEPAGPSKKKKKKAFYIYIGISIGSCATWAKQKEWEKQKSGWI